jgi:hypothetical protein
VDCRCPVKKPQLQRGLLIGAAIEPVLPDTGLKKHLPFSDSFFCSAKIEEQPL